MKPDDFNPWISGGSFTVRLRRWFYLRRYYTSHWWDQLWIPDLTITELVWGKTAHPKLVKQYECGIITRKQLAQKLRCEAAFQSVVSI